MFAQSLYFSILQTYKHNRLLRNKKKTSAKNVGDDDYR